MIYFSGVLGLPIVDADRVRVGQVDDVLVESAGAVERILLRRGRVREVLTWAEVAHLSPDKRLVVLVEGATPRPHPGNGTEGEFLSLKRDVLDRQIIDTLGRKVVRVNDIVLEVSGGRLYLRSIEVGLAGALRRLLAGIVPPRLVVRMAAGFSQKVIRWDYVGLVEPRTATIRLKVHQQLARLHPADLADILEDLGRVERQAVVASLDNETAAEALAEAEPEVQASVVEEIHPEKAADILEEMPPDDAADILGDMSAESSQAVLEAMEEDEAEDVRELLHFPDDSAGGLMTTEFFRAGPEWSAGDVLEALRGFDDRLAEELDEVPVVSEDGHLIGVAPLVRLLRAPASQPVRLCCREEMPVVAPSAGFDEVAGWFDKYHLRVLAVTDDFGTLVGLINAQDVLSRLVRPS